jgi:hypothetical protein
MNILYSSVDRNKYQIQIPLPPKIDPSVTMMTVEEKPDVTYNDVGGCKEQIEKMREVTILLESLCFLLIHTGSPRIAILRSTKIGQVYTKPCCCGIVPYRFTRAVYMFPSLMEFASVLFGN